MQKEILLTTDIQQVVSDPITIEGQEYKKVLVKLGIEAREHTGKLRKKQAYIILPEGELNSAAAWDFGLLLQKIADPREECIACITKEDLQKIARAGWSETDKIRMSIGTYP